MRDPAPAGIPEYALLRRSWLLSRTWVGNGTSQVVGQSGFLASW